MKYSKKNSILEKKKSVISPILKRGYLFRRLYSKRNNKLYRHYCGHKYIPSSTGYRRRLIRYISHLWKEKAGAGPLIITTLRARVGEPLAD
jgi:hypothetical protein